VKISKSQWYYDVTHPSVLDIGFSIAIFILVAYAIQIISPFGFGWLLAICFPLATIVLTPVAPVVGMGAFVFLSHGLPRYNAEFAQIQELMPLFPFATIAVFAGWIVRGRKDGPQIRWSNPGVVICTLFVGWLLICFWVGYFNNYQWTFSEFSRHHPINHLSGYVFFLMAVQLLGNKDATYFLAAIFICSILLGGIANPKVISLNSDLGAMVPIALPLAFLLFKSSSRSPAQILWSVTVVGLIILLLFTKNRAGLVGLIVASILSIFVILPNKKIAASAVVTAGLLLVLVIPSDYVDRFSVLWNPNPTHATASLDQATIEGRLTLWECSSNFVRNEPIWGVGTGNFPKVIHQCNPDLYRLPAHNNFISFAVESGLVGLMLYIALIISIYYAGLRRRREEDKWKTTAKGLLVASFSAYLAVSFFVSRHDMVFAYMLMGWIVALDIKLEINRNHEPNSH